MTEAEAVREYWTERAEASDRDPSATTQDVHLRRLEIDTFVSTIESLSLPGTFRLLDVGCGDGFSTLQIAARVPRAEVRAVDYSGGMIQNARANLAAQPALAERVTFSEGDVTCLDLPDAHVDVAMTDRCLINLTSSDAQAGAIAQIARVIKPGGYYLAIENFTDGQEALTAARADLGLPEIPVRWHNRYFEPEAFRQWVEPYFEIERIDDFSSTYYMATRVLYSRLCQMDGTEPDYDHPIHQVATELPATTGFSPIKLAILKRREGGSR